MGGEELPPNIKRLELLLRCNEAQIGELRSYSSSSTFLLLGSNPQLQRSLQYNKQVGQFYAKRVSCRILHLEGIVFVLTSWGLVSAQATSRAVCGDGVGKG